MRWREVRYRHNSTGRPDGSEVGLSLDKGLHIAIEYAYTAAYTKTS